MGCGYAPTARRRGSEPVMEREPRPTATMPDWTISRMPNGSSTRTSAASLSRVPVASIGDGVGGDVDDLGAEQLHGLEDVAAAW